MTHPGSEAADPVPLFLVEGTYYFKYYFEDRAVFDELSRYYNEGDYRFEVPADALDTVVAVLERAGKTPRPLERFDDYVVAKKKYTDHPDVLFKRSVLRDDDGGYNLFLMQDRAAVDAAVTSGGVPLGDTQLSFNP